MQQARGLEGFDILVHPAIVAAGGLGQGEDVVGAVLVNVPQQLQPLG